MSTKSIDFRERILHHHAKLTGSQKRAADYILKNSSISAVSSAGEIGKKSGVSESTVIRLCYTLGYQGFSEMQKEMQTQLLENRSNLGEFVESKETIAKEPHFYANVMERDRKHISQLIQQVDEKLLDEAVAAFINASKILVVGVQASYPPALWFKNTLNLLRGGVSVYQEDTDRLFFLMDELDENAVVVVLTFHRYGTKSVQIAKAAHEKGIKVIAITDSPLSPVTQYSDILISLELIHLSTIDTIGPLFSLLHSLAAAYSVKDSERVKKRLEIFEKEDT